MQALTDRAGGLLLLTATPMQVHPVEVWDLLNLLGLPADWTEAAFLRFFEDVGQSSPSADAVERMARLFRAAERQFGEVTEPDARKMSGLSPLRARAGAPGAPRRRPASRAASSKRRNAARRWS